MKGTTSHIIALLALLAMSQAVHAQVFSTMSEAKRNAALIKIAKKVYRHPVFKDIFDKYGDNGKPTIRSYVVSKDAPRSPLTKGKDIGELQYEVIFYSDKDEKYGKIRAARIIISDKTGVAWTAIFGTRPVYTRWNTPEAFE